MSWLEAVLLGLVQGLTEFLPVSSSGHLVLGQRLLGLDTSGNIVFEVFVHFGTVLSIITVYHRRIVDLTKETFGALLRPGELRARYGQSADLRFVGYILITLVPTGIVYVLFKDSLEAAFDDPRLVCGMLLVTGLLLLLTLLRPHPDGPLSLVKAFVIGVAQSAAMIPGISRSGATICTALYQNVTPEQAANFSFLMLLPGLRLRRRRHPADARLRAARQLAVLCLLLLRRGYGGITAVVVSSQWEVGSGVVDRTTRFTPHPTGHLPFAEYQFDTFCFKTLYFVPA